MKVVVWLPNEIRAFEQQPEQLAALAARHPHHSFVGVRDEAAFLRELTDAEVALVWHFSAAWYERAPKLRVVATPAAGREKLERDPSGRVRAVHGHFHGQIMAETLLAMMLFCARRLGQAIAAQRARRYEREPYAATRRLAGQHALIVGYGPLGRECARLLTAIGVRVTGVKRSPNVEPGPAQAVRPVTELHELLPHTDHVVLTLPGDTGADHLISDAELLLMKPSATLYNLGRGNAVDEAALLHALRSGQIAGAFLDVFEREPLPVDSPLWDAPNLALLPHASAISQEYLELWFQELGPELDSLR